MASLFKIITENNCKNDILPEQSINITYLINKYLFENDSNINPNDDTSLDINHTIDTLLDINTNDDTFKNDNNIYLYDDTFLDINPIDDGWLEKKILSEKIPNSDIEDILNEDYTKQHLPDVTCSNILKKFWNDNPIEKIEEKDILDFNYSNEEKSQQNLEKIAEKRLFRYQEEYKTQRDNLQYMYQDVQEFNPKIILPEYKIGILEGIYAENGDKLKIIQSIKEKIEKFISNKNIFISGKELRLRQLNESKHIGIQYLITTVGALVNKNFGCEQEGESKQCGGGEQNSVNKERRDRNKYKQFILYICDDIGEYSDDMDPIYDKCKDLIKRNFLQYNNNEEDWEEVNKIFSKSPFVELGKYIKGMYLVLLKDDMQRELIRK